MTRDYVLHVLGSLASILGMWFADTVQFSKHLAPDPSLLLGSGQKSKKDGHPPGLGGKTTCS